MAHEILNEGLARPDRIAALVSFLDSTEGSISEPELGNFMMPGVQDSQRSILRSVVNESKWLGLIETKKGNYILAEDTKKSLKKKEVSRVISELVLSARKQSDNNYLLVQFFAWLLACVGWPGGINPFDATETQIAEEFNAQLGGDRDDRLFNSTKFRSFVNWASYLGFGYRINQKFVPYPSELIRSDLSQILEQKKELSANDFMNRLAEIHPYLDGGEIFLSLPQNDRSEVSPCVSAALRSLHDEQVIQLVPTTDAPKQVVLFSDLSHQVTRGITRVRLLEVSK